MPSFLPLLLLGGAAIILTRKKKVVTSSPRVVTLQNKEGLKASFASLLKKQGRPYVVLGFRQHDASDPKAPQIGRIREVFANVSAEYPQVDFFEYPEPMQENFKALGVTGAARVRSDQIEILHMDPDPEGEWAILSPDEASGDFRRAAQWASGQIEVESQLNMSEAFGKGENLLKALLEAFGRIVPGPGPAPGPGPGPGPRPSNYMREVMCMNDECTWKIFDSLTRQLVRRLT
jgi:hypothetical protein